MKTIASLTLNSRQSNQLLQLWNTEFPAILNHADVDAFEENIASWGNVNHHLAIDGQDIGAWLADFDRDGQRWFALIVSKRFQGHGWGTRLLQLAQQSNDELYGWVIDEPGYLKTDGSEYQSPLGFYLRLGFGIKETAILEKYGIKATKISWQA